MAIVERPPSQVALEPAATPAAPSIGVFARPSDRPGWQSWLFTVDHKRIGIMYGVAALAFFIIGGIEALLIRAQLFAPDGRILNANQYDQMFTMHATTMIFLFAMPMASALGNYLVPLQIGARDVAFPRVNLFSFWCFLTGGLFVNAGWFLGGAADGGWFMYAPNSSPLFSPSHGIDFWTIGLLINGIGSLTGAVNLIVTVVNMRAPGMKIMRVPTLSWMTMVTQFIMLFAMPVITVALILLTLQRNFGATFFDVHAGADPLLWQHLFWIFGHPEVYILILPAFGIVSEVLPVFARKPLFGYPIVVLSGAAIGVAGWGVWAHHMFASGLGPISVTTFSISSMAIAIPTGVKIINWTLTLWGGKLRFTTAAHYAIGMVVLFTIGGLSGVTHAVSPADTQQTDTYYIVAHIHYVLFGGTAMAFFSAFYYWWPKAFGKCLNESLGKVSFWTMFVGMNLAFGPMHILGLQGQPRRMQVWTEARAGEGFFNLGFWNQVSTIGAFILAIGILLFIINVIHTHRRGAPAPLDPWDARTLEWMTTSPPQPHNFNALPTVHHLDEFFHRKYEDVGEPDHPELRQVATAEEILASEQARSNKPVRLPNPSYWPLALSIALPVIGFGLIYNTYVAIFGCALTLMCVFGWALEPAFDDDADDGGSGPAPTTDPTPTPSITAT